MTEFNREDRIPKAGPKMWIERVGAGGENLFTIFSLSIYGVWTHWGLYGSQPCLAERSKCSGCAGKLPKRWKGYLHCYDHHAKRQVFLELTPMSAESIVKQLGEDQPLRGYRVKIKRGNGPKARLKVEVMIPLPGGPPLVEEKYPEETLRQLWGFTGEDGGTAAGEVA